MIYLLSAIVSSVLVSIIMRLSENYMKNNISMLAVNYTVCVMAAGFHMWTSGVPFKVCGEGAGMAVGLGLINGFLYLFSFVLMQISVRRNGVVLSAVFMKLGVLVPAVTAIVFFGEMPTVVQICGFVIALAAIVLIQLEKDQSDITFKAGLILLLAAGGSEMLWLKYMKNLAGKNLRSIFFFIPLLRRLFCALHWR